MKPWQVLWKDCFHCPCQVSRLHYSLGSTTKMQLLTCSPLFTRHIANVMAWVPWVETKIISHWNDLVRVSITEAPRCQISIKRSYWNCGTKEAMLSFCPIPVNFNYSYNCDKLADKQRSMFSTSNVLCRQTKEVLCTTGHTTVQRHTETEVEDWHVCLSLYCTLHYDLTASGHTHIYIQPSLDWTLLLAYWLY